MRRAPFLCCLFVLALARSAFGQGHLNILTLTFDQLKDGESILDFYNGGFGDMGSGPGPKLGITFSAGSEALTSLLAGGNGNFQNEPSLNNVAFFRDGAGDIMNVAGGFTDGFSFYYAAAIFPGSVTVWSGPNGTGTMLASLNLPVLGSLPGLPTVNNIWAPVGVAFDGTAQSVNFSGTANFIGFDNVTLGSAVPTGVTPTTPAPSALVPVALALLLGAGKSQFRRRRAATQ